MYNIGHNNRMSQPHTPLQALRETIKSKYIILLIYTYMFIIYTYLDVCM